MSGMPSRRELGTDHGDAARKLPMLPRWKRHRPTPLAVRASPIGPSPSSRFAAPPLRYGRYAMTAPSRRGILPPCSLLREAGPQGRFGQQRAWKPTAWAARRGQGLRAFASNPRSGLGLDAEHGSGSAAPRRLTRSGERVAHYPVGPTCGRKFGGPNRHGRACPRGPVGEFGIAWKGRGWRLVETNSPSVDPDSGYKIRTRGSPPPLWGRVREGGRAWYEPGR